MEAKIINCIISKCIKSRLRAENEIANELKKAMNSTMKIKYAETEIDWKIKGLLSKNETKTKN